MHTKMIQGRNFNPKTVSADKGYSSYRILQIINNIGATPFIAFKDNSKPNKNSPQIWIKMFNYFSNHKELFLKSYHRRSNVETTFSMIKMRLGEFLKSKNYEAQRNELMMKFIVHNITCLISEIYENNIHVNFKDCLNKYVEMVLIFKNINGEPAWICIPDRLNIMLFGARQSSFVTK